jgi:hypothetical protein
MVVGHDSAGERGGIADALLENMHELVLEQLEAVARCECVLACSEIHVVSSREGERA